MAELKKEFEILEFEDVKTYLNSGNVFFLSDKNDTERFKKQIEIRTANTVRKTVGM